ncbi:MAG: alanine racemase [Candidatus Berkiella sp.]
MGRQVIAKVSASALAHNVAVIRKLSKNAKILAMVKANAYGHGLVQVAKALANVDALGVASIEEALNIRKAGVKTDIVLMEGIFNPDELSLVQTHRLILVIHHFAQVQALQQYQKPLLQKFKVWLKINTGMNRLGFSPREFQDAHAMLTQLPQVELIGFMTHFAKADEKDNDSTRIQYQQFYDLIGERKGQKSLANSAGILAWPEAHADWVRPGLILYGASPFPNSCGHDLNLKPAMSLYSTVIAVREVAQGEQVGYGGMWESFGNSSKIAIVAMGYGDGYPWHAKNGTPVLINQQRAGTVGRISMDMLAVDVSALNNVKVGDPVVLWGEGLPIEEVARHAGTIPYELFCRFTERVTVELAQ